MMESRVEDGLKLEKQLPISYSESNRNLAEKNGLHDGHSHVDDMHDENLLQMVLEFKFENEFFKSQYEGFKSLELEKASGQLGGESEDAKELHERIQLLNKELSVERQTRGAAEEALKHLQTAYSEADSRAQELSAMLAEAQQKFDQEIKQREEKYSELDTKFTRLHKRAKQRIQEVQKLNDDLESRFHDVSEKAKNQKIVENLEAQIADAFSDRSKATETISSLQVLLAQKESKIAEMDIASTGEAARLRVVVESVKGELLHLKHEHV